MNPVTEYVVLVDKNNNAIGTALKSEVHTADTPLHRAFSLFLFNSKGELLLQQRSHAKKTWPLVWSNSCCGHPMPDEDEIAAVKRRTQYELGITLDKVHKIIPNYLYRYEHKGVVEHEFCPVFVAFTHVVPQPNPLEVESIQWQKWEDFLEEIKINEKGYSEWCVEEAGLMAKDDIFNKLYASYGK
jgi:isopentenyl-diphosphate delta-isomerase